jgi:hypothetical protein
MTQQPVHRVIARYQNGLILKGHTTDFLPADQRSNNERCYVLTTATREIALL